MEGAVLGVRGDAVDLGRQQRGEQLLEVLRIVEVAE